MTQMSTGYCCWLLAAKLNQPVTSYAVQAGARPTDADVDEAPQGGGPLHRLCHIARQGDAAAGKQNEACLACAGYAVEHACMHLLMQATRRPFLPDRHQHQHAPASRTHMGIVNLLQLQK